MIFAKRKMNKKGWIALLLWGGAALAAGIGYLINSTKPAPTGVPGIINSIPIYGWIIIGLILLVLLRR